MWRDHWHPEFAVSHGCLVVLNHSAHYGLLFDFPLPLPEEGDVDAALDEIDAWCVENAAAPAFGVVPDAERNRLLTRYPYTTFDCVRTWHDYIYHAEDLSSFAGRRYSGQRNHINKFRKLYPNAVYRELTKDDRNGVEKFWQEFHKIFNKDDAEAKLEVCYARRIMQCAGEDWAKTGCVEIDGNIVAIALAEVCGDTLMCHIEKALPQFEGVYPFMVQAFAAANSKGLAWINREDDAGDRGLRTSKLQYLPAFLETKTRVMVRNELSGINSVPMLISERLVLDEIRDEDLPNYNRLCLDDVRNKWWGYDYRNDLHGQLSDHYFLNVAREDFQKKLALNFAVRLDGTLIGEVVLYHFDYKGRAELGCRILPEFAGAGYGSEAFRKAADWCLYSLGLCCLRAKCFHQNTASKKMLESCMRPAGEDDTFYYFEKIV